ncbi:MAG: Hsp33 family molecular chaperone HslO [Gammaproteobacteria bacterium]
MSDTLQRFLFERHPIRGSRVQLHASWQAVLERHEYPVPVRQLLGEMMSAAVLLTTTLKVQGRMIMQVQGSGPLKLMVVECSNTLSLRAVAKCDEHIEAGSLSELLGDGQLVITLETEHQKERYQSIVELTGESLAEALSRYLNQSDQLATYLWLAADPLQSAGLLIQRLPETGMEKDEDAWNRVCQLSSTVTAPELLQLSHAELLHRLYHEEDVRVFDAEPVCFRCSCSRERVANMFLTLGYAEVMDMLKEQGKLEVACEFCYHKYEFDQIDVEQLFASDTPRAPDTHLH